MIVAIGAESDNYWGPETGSVSIYKYINNDWNQIGNIINGEEGYEYTGSSISISSDGFILSLGAFGNSTNGNNSGSARVYKYSNNNWNKIADIKGDTINEFVGRCVALSSDGNYLATIGGLRKNGLYKNNSGIWKKIGNSVNPKNAFVSLSGNGKVMAVGDYLNSENGTNAGQVQVYDFSKVLRSDEIVLLNMSFFPNPSSDIINIQLDNNLVFQKVNIYNTLGQFIRTETKSIINIQNLSKGSYFFEVITDRGKATKLIEIE
jgi:hypothetical protein